MGPQLSLYRGRVGPDSEAKPVVSGGEGKTGVETSGDRGSLDGPVSPVFFESLQPYRKQQAMTNRQHIDPSKWTAPSMGCLRPVCSCGFTRFQA
jgi:hypothetical protein